MNELALFAGAGGGLLATQHLLGWRTVCYVEDGSYPVEVLKARIWDGLLDDAPIWGDVRTFDGRPWRGCVDIVTAGFPCQPFSGAGKRLLDRDKRNCWPDTARIIDEIRPRYVFLENVPTLRCPDRRNGGNPAYFGRVLGDLAESGYDARWDCIPASAVGAPHQRDRVWIVAYTHHGRSQRTQDPVRPGRSVAELCGQDVAHTNTRRLSGDSNECESEAIVFSRTNAAGIGLGRPAWWQTEPAVGRVVDGLAHRVDRLAAIGEGQVPEVVARVWSLLN